MPTSQGASVGPRPARVERSTRARRGPRGKTNRAVAAILLVRISRP